LATKMQMACDAEMVLKFLFVDVNGWTVWTLKSDGCGAKGAKLLGSYTSSRIVDAESWCTGFFSMFWVRFLCLQVYCIWFLLFSWAELLSWCWWWSKFIVDFDGLLNENADHGE
jgi:hypothetical protein